jgi:hydrogenase large subunit
LYGIRRFLEKTLFNVPLEQIAAMTSSEALVNYAVEDSPVNCDFRHFLHIAQALDLEKLGRAQDRFMSYGSFPHEGSLIVKSGVWMDGFLKLNASRIYEDLSHSWMADDALLRHPFDGVTQPSLEAENGYSWCKAPRLDGNVMEVGALARQLVDGQALIQALVKESGGNVKNRVIARLLEIARIVPLMEQWAKAILPGESFCIEAKLPGEAIGAGMVEAARGGLGHWLKISNGRIQNYQIVAPTTWNFSPRDREGQPGPLEQALLGARVHEGEREPIEVQHIVRSFDPCMVCTVH